MRGGWALAKGALAAGVSLVCGYPGAPATAVVEAIAKLAGPERVRVEWNSNEKVALEMAFGASVGGRRSLLCIKSVGLNIALDPLMVINLSGCNAGLVLLVGDDPGSWGSQNEQDSRALGLAAEIPILEPCTVPEALAAMERAFHLSEELNLPVMVRVTRALVLAEGALDTTRPHPVTTPPPDYQREFMRWVVLPINAVTLRQKLRERLETVQAQHEVSPLNGITGQGSQGVIAAGFAFQKLMDTLRGQVPPGLQVLGLGTFYPLPAGLLTTFLKGVNAVLVLEESAPLVEGAVRAVAQAAGLTLPIYGRETGHVPVVGELFGPQIAAAMNAWSPSLNLPAEGPSGRPRPSRDPLCEGCPYIPTLEALRRAMERRGSRERYVVVGEPGCMVRAQLPPYQLMDIKNSLGSSIGMATGVSLSGVKAGVVALCGDSAFLHSGLPALIDAVQLGARFLLIILDNGTTALSGGQPHPASGTDLRGRVRPAVDLAALVQAAGVSSVQVVDLDAGKGIEAPIETGLERADVNVVIARGRCTRWSA
jgi:indolepyruvate ferredoxin oxidoreductase alpha subunit